MMLLCGSVVHTALVQLSHATAASQCNSGRLYVAMACKVHWVDMADSSSFQ